MAKKVTKTEVKETAKPEAKKGYETSEITCLQILDAAERLFLKDGFESVSNRAILRESGQRNLGALEYHFGGREGLLLAIEERRANQVKARRQTILAESLAH